MPLLFSIPHQTRKIGEFLAKPEVKEMSAGLEEIAQAVAVAVEDKALTDIIYAKCMEKFDGETNTLWMHLEADSKIKAQGGWNKRVDAELSKGRKNATVKGIGNIDAAVRKFEKTIGAPLHLFWMYPSAWDKKTTPIVVYTPVGQDPEKIQSADGFDAQGNRYIVDREFAKHHPIIVLTFNERTNLNGQLLSNIISATNNNSSVQSASVIVTEVDFKGNGDQYEMIIFGGDPEFRAESREPGGSTNLSTLNYTMPRASVPSKINPNSVLLAATIGSATQVTWWEVDVATEEWVLGEDDFLGTHQVASGMNTYSTTSLLGANYTW
jgi:hypothetical protein